MTQTPIHVSLLQQLLQYFELAASVAQVIPEPHVRAIGGIIGLISTQLQNGQITAEHVQAVNEGLLPMGMMMTPIPNPIVSGGLSTVVPIDKGSYAEQFLKGSSGAD